MRAEEMNECVMNGNGMSVCRSREEERLKMKRGRRIREDVRRRGGGRRGIPGILLLRESSLACVLLSPTLFHTGTHTHRHTLSLQCKEAEQTYVRRCFQCQLILPPPPPVLSVTSIVQGGNERLSALVLLSPAVPWLSAEPVIIKSCSFYCYRMIINPNFQFGVWRDPKMLLISQKIHH